MSVQMPNMPNMEADLRSVLHAVLMGVCTRCDFVHGEALRPSGNSCLVQVLTRAPRPDTRAQSAGWKLAGSLGRGTAPAKRAPPPPPAEELIGTDIASETGHSQLLASAFTHPNH